MTFHSNLTEEEEKEKNDREWDEGERRFEDERDMED
jgi:hypothetical protein